MRKLTDLKSIRAGDSLGFESTVYNCQPSEGWTASYTIVSATGSYTFDSTISSSGLDFVFSVSSSTTATWLPGYYAVQGYATKGEQRITFDSGNLTIQPNLATATAGLDPRSHVRRTLDALEAVIEGRATEDTLSQSVDGRSLSLMSHEQLMAARNRYYALWKQEEDEQRLKNGERNPNIFHARFPDPTYSTYRYRGGN